MTPSSFVEANKATAIPDYVINYVTRTREIVILDDAFAHPTFSAEFLHFVSVMQGLFCACRLSTKPR